MSSQPYIPYTGLPEHLGIQKGENLMIASDITRLAMTAIRREGAFDADKLIDSFLQALGPEGTLILPAFNFNLKNSQAFDPVKTLPVTGALAEAAMKRTDFLRTRHPLHSFLVSGKYAGELAARENLSSFGPDSPFAFFHRKDMLMLMLGTGVTEAFTFVHYVEELEKVRYRRYAFLRIKYLYPDGEQDWKQVCLYAKRPGWTMNLASLEKLFREKGILSETTFNGIPCAMIRLGEAFPLIREDIVHNRSRSISHFSWTLFAREKLKKVLSSLHLYRTLTDKISHDPGPR